MSKAKALAITGATGFVGSTTLDAALEQGIAVRALTRREQPARDGVTWVQGDLDDADALTDLVQGVDAVVHIAGLTNTPDPAQFEHANVSGTANVIAAMKAKAHKRLVFVSSLSAREPALSQYGASKAKAEELVAQSGGGEVSAYSFPKRGKAEAAVLDWAMSGHDASGSGRGKPSQRR